MPKVSDEHLATRRAQILDAARRCFGRNGFHATSMQDLFDEAGLSAGAVYRYFESKDQVILAIATEGMTEVLEAMSQVTGACANGSVGDALAAAVEIVERKQVESGVCGLAVQVWAEAVRSPALGAQFAQKLTAVNGELATLVRRMQGEGRLPRDVAPDALAGALACTLPGYLVHRALLGPDAVVGVPDALRALYR